MALKQVGHVRTGGGAINANFEEIDARATAALTPIVSAGGALTVAAHSGKIILTTANVTVPHAAGSKGFHCTLIAGGAHTVTFNSTASAAMAAGDRMDIIVDDDASGTPSIIGRLTAVAGQVAFS